MGVTAKACRKGEAASVRCTGFVSSEDGQDLITHLEQFPSQLLAKAVGESVPRSQVDSLLAIIRRDGTATVYVNEMRPKLMTRIANAKEKGDLIFKDDIVDITTAEIGVHVPPDAAVVIVFSWGWRKGFFYDFGPVGPNGQPRAFDVPSVLGQLFARMMFQERFRITDGEWENLFAAKWFPFVGLRNETIALMLTHVRQGWNIDGLVGTVADELKSKLPSFVESWNKHPALAPHASILEKAAEHFLAGDHLSCTGLLFPRIEGILRSNHADLGKGHVSQASLCKSAVSANADRDCCLLLPHRFEAYLSSVYFASFNPNDASISVSRNSVGHGVADPAGFNEKSSSIGLLVINQLFHSFGQPERPQADYRVGRRHDPVA